MTCYPVLGIASLRGAERGRWDTHSRSVLRRAEQGDVWMLHQGSSFRDGTW